MADLDIHQFPCRADNYGVLIHDAAAGITASIDAPDPDAVRAALKEKGWRLTHILVTHHHDDHVAGVPSLKAETGCHVIGPKGDAARIPSLDTEVGEGQTISFRTFQVNVIETPGHTAGHVCYWIPAAGVAFVGDTLFAMGCGRIFEGTPEIMWRSLCKLKELPAQTRLYCGHEYTVANARFALTIEPGNEKLVQRLKDAEARRAAGQPTLPTRLDDELETNPFLRPHIKAIRERLDMPGDPDWKVFARIRELKNKA